MDRIDVNDTVALLIDRPELGLCRGEVGTVIQVFESTVDHPAGLYVEFVDETGKVQPQIDITDLSQL